MSNRRAMLILAMVDVKTIKDADLTGKKILVRVDIDVNPDTDINDIRLQSMLPTVNFLLQNNVEHIFLAGHMGRFKDGEESKSTLTIKPVLEKLLNKALAHGEQITSESKINLLENLRSTKDEEENNDEFAKHLASLADIFVNDAFATSHRSHASIVGVPKYLPSYLGLRFSEEITVLTKLLENPERPLVTLISGIKEDKVEMIENLKHLSDRVLVAGRLPEYIDPDYGKGPGRPEYVKDPKIILGRLIQDREDVTIHTVEQFEAEIKQAKTIILAGVVGKYEEEGHRQGTKRVFEAVANSNAYKVVGGGDSLAVLNMFNLAGKFDWISVGGGAMLEYLNTKSLVGLEALQR